MQTGAPGRRTGSVGSVQPPGAWKLESLAHLNPFGQEIGWETSHSWPFPQGLESRVAEKHYVVHMRSQGPGVPSLCPLPFLPPPPCQSPQFKSGMWGVLLEN